MKQNKKTSFKIKSEWSSDHSYLLEKDEDGNTPKVFRVIAYNSKNKKIAVADIADHPLTGDVVWNVWVAPRYRRKGIATALYVYSEEKLFTTLHPSPGGHSQDAHQLWTQKNRPFGPKAD